MTGCDVHGELIGGYVLGALSPEESVAMRVHLGTCTECAAEYERLAGLPALLDRIEPADVPPPLPSPGLEETVLDRFAHERGRRRPPRPVPVIGAAAGDAGSAGRTGWPRPRSAARRRLLVAAAALAALAVVGAILASALAGDGETPYARGTLAGANGAAGGFSVENVANGTRVYLKADRLPRAGSYEVWCVRTDGRWISGGSFRSDAAGSATATLTAAVRPGDYHTLVVTRDGAGGRRGPVAMKGDLVY